MNLRVVVLRFYMIPVQCGTFFIQFYTVVNVPNDFNDALKKWREYAKHKKL